MAKAELKTKKNDASVADFLNAIPDEARRKDCFAVLELMKKATKAEPKMWGSNIVGLGDLHYKYASGREGDWFQMGFSPRKENLTLYFMPGLHLHEDSLSRLGKYKIGKSCLYLKSLGDIDIKVLKEMMAQTVKILKTQS
ncbi:MAG TPA: DUF1801 domain-containing protein [Blastocatellia bacterium]|nr:DUF1801 domain-containing protein [Blastocatellia bacterium]